MVNISTGILSLSLLALLSACGGNSTANMPDGVAAAAAVEAQSTSLTQEELKILGEADAHEVNSNFEGSIAPTEVVGLSKGFKLFLKDQADLSKAWDGIAECSTGSNFSGMWRVDVNCPLVVGTTLIVIDGEAGTFDRKLNYEVKGAFSSASFKHHFLNMMFGNSATRTIDDVLKTPNREFAIKGESQFLRSDGSAVAFSGKYTIQKNAGPAIELTVTSEGLKEGFCGLNSGSINYETSTGLTYKHTFPACPVIVMPPIFLPPMPVIPVIQPN